MSDGLDLAADAREPQQHRALRGLALLALPHPAAEGERVRMVIEFIGGPNDGELLQVPDGLAEFVLDTLVPVAGRLVPHRVVQGRYEQSAGNPTDFVWQGHDG